jgi:hypothetical protein
MPRVAFLRVPRGTRVDFDPGVLGAGAVGIEVCSAGMVGDNLVFLTATGRGASVGSLAERLRFCGEVDMTTGCDWGSVFVLWNTKSVESWLLAALLVPLRMVGILFSLGTDGRSLREQADGDADRVVKLSEDTNAAKICVIVGGGGCDIIVRAD